jgi:hypothetical protein
LQAQAPADDVTAEVVHEGDQVHLLAVAGQVEAGDVGLPQLAGLGTLESPRQGCLLPTFGRGTALGQSFFLNHASDDRRACLQPFEAGQEALYLAQAEVRELSLQLLDAFAQSRVHGLATGLAADLLVAQGFGAFGSICLQPPSQDPFVQSPRFGEVLLALPGLAKGLHRLPTLIGGECPLGLSLFLARLGFAATLPLIERCVRHALGLGKVFHGPLPSGQGFKNALLVLRWVWLAPSGWPCLTCLLLFHVRLL